MDWDEMHVAGVSHLASAEALARVSIEDNCLSPLQWSADTEFC